MERAAKAWMDDERRSGLTSGRTDVRTEEWAVQRQDGRTEERTDGEDREVEERTDRVSNGVQKGRRYGRR